MTKNCGMVLESSGLLFFSRFYLEAACPMYAAKVYNNCAQTRIGNWRAPSLVKYIFCDGTTDAQEMKMVFAAHRQLIKRCALPVLLDVPQLGCRLLERRRRVRPSRPPGFTDRLRLTSGA